MTTMTQVMTPRFVDLLRAEWIKLSSLPSTWIALLGMFLVGGIGGFTTGFRALSAEAAQYNDMASTVYNLTMLGGALCPVFAGILGVLAMGAEYTSGTIQPTLLSTPARLRVLLAKALLLFGAVFVVAFVMIFAAWGASYPLFATHGLDAPLTAPGVLAALLGVPMYLGLVAVFGLGVAAFLRSSTAGAIVIFVVVFLGPGLSMMLPPGVLSTVVRTMIIGNGGYSMVQLPAADGPFMNLQGYLSPAAGFLLVFAWTGVALVAGALALKKKDA